jgi:hypothetical protein
MANSTVDVRLTNVHPQMLRVDGETNRKKIAALIERALELLGISKQDAAFRMGYSDPGTVSRWCTAVERPHLDKLLTIDGFENAWLLAQAERNPNADIVHQIVLRRVVGGCLVLAALFAGSCASRPRRIIFYPVVACDYRMNIAGHVTVARLPGVGDARRFPNVQAVLLRCYSAKDAK